MKHSDSVGDQQTSLYNTAQYRKWRQ